MCNVQCSTQPSPVCSPASRCPILQCVRCLICFEWPMAVSDMMRMMSWPAGCLCLCCARPIFLDMCHETREPAGESTGAVYTTNTNTTLLQKRIGEIDWFLTEKSLISGPMILLIIWKWKNSNAVATFEMSLNYQDQGFLRSGWHFWILQLKSFILSPFFGLFINIL